MLVEIAEELRLALSVSPPSPPHSLSSGRRRFLTHFGSRSELSRPQQHRHLQLTVFRAGLKIAGEFAVAMLLVLTLWVPLSREIVGAAYESKPGQVLYSLKTSVDRLRFTGTSEPDARLALGLAFLGERVARTQAMVSQGQEIDYGSVVEVQQLVNQVLQASAMVPERTVLEILDYVGLQLQSYEHALCSAAVTAPVESAVAIQQIRKALESGVRVAEHALQDPTGFRRAYQAGRPELFTLPGGNPPQSLTPHSEWARI